LPLDVIFKKLKCTIFHLDCGSGPCRWGAYRGQLQTDSEVRGGDKWKKGEDEKGREGKGRGGDHTASNSKPLSVLFMY